MNKQVIISAAVFATIFAASLGVGIVSASSSAVPPQEELIIAGKKPARFIHPTHLSLGLDCASCHHDKQHQPMNAEAIGALGDRTALKCTTCHNSDHPNKDLQTAKDVFHAKCKDCHKKGAAGKKGPTKCTSCHLKKKAYEGC